MSHLRNSLILFPLNFLFWLSTTAYADCNNPSNPIEKENCLTGTPQSQWDVSGAGDDSIQGFATDISFNKGDTVHFKISTFPSVTNYRLDIYRMGYYQGNGARLVAASINPTATLPQNQPACIRDNATALYDCGNWAESASWTIPTTSVSGIYFAKLVRTDGTTGSSHIVFIVRDDSSTSDLLFQASDTTWQAYNDFGGSNLYTGGPGPQGGAYKVSYNRPFHTRVYENFSWVFNAEYPMFRWLEANGYNVTYFSDTDADRHGGLIKQHKVYLSVGHDEYWSGAQRANVEAARAAGVHLAFFSGNEIFWKTRWEADSSGGPNRTLVCYKETHYTNTPFVPTDPADPPVWTGTWRDARLSPPADGGRPENALSGNIFMVNGPWGPSQSIKVPAADGQMRFWRNTAVATQGGGQTYVAPAGTLGYEWDEDLDNGSRPPGVVRLSTATYNVPSGNLLLDNGSTYGSGTAVHHLTFYKHSSGALVFGAGSVQWSWGLDAEHDNFGTAIDVNMQQATVNLLADMNVQPATLQNPLTAASASSDTVPPTSTITSPAANSTVSAGSTVTISGTAADVGGGVVGGVEVSTDGGNTWHPATGRATWSYSWTVPNTAPAATIGSRAVDDSGNLESPTSSVTVQISGGAGPQITNVAASNVTDTAATIIWTTDQPSDSQVAYGTTNSYGNLSSLNSSLVTSHSVALSGLQAATTYHYQVRSRNSSNVLSTSGDATFTTSSGSGTGSCPCTIWSPSTVPTNASANDPNAVELGVKFTSDQAGSINGIRFYKGSANTGTHVGNLWTSSGNLLATATFTNETATGWQQINFSQPVAINANTTYVASYHTNTGGYAFDSNYFATSGTNNAPLHALANGTSGGNGVYVYGGSAFPTQTFQSTNYWVDVVFVSAGPDTSPPTVTSVSPSANSTGATTSTSVTATFNEQMTANSISGSTFQLRDSSNNQVGATVTYNSGTNTAVLQPTSALATSATYTATIAGGTGGVTDLAGNAMTSNFTWSFTTGGPTPPPPTQGPGGPILVVTSASDNFATFFAEILRNEGFNEFSVGDISDLTASTLSNYTLVILGHMSLTSPQVSMFTNWVNSGGSLIAMRPDKQLASLLGLTDAGATRADAYLLVNATSGPGVGIVGQTMQYHSVADLYNVNGATTLARLYSNASTSTSNPAVTMISVGSNGGQAAAFTYDLARSVVYTRQGNPAWSGQERDGQAPIRSDDLYFGGSVPDYVDLNKVSIPQADEQMRLLANMILSMNKTPLPRFWYFPSGFKAVVVMTGDDHANGGTAGRFDTYIADSPGGCNVADWECVRSTSYVYPGSPLTNAQAASYTAQGFEVALHPSVAGSANNSCADFASFSQLDSIFATQLSQWQSQYA
ncbi:MAG: hypothetical protein JWO20_2128, partial [Candidatus Angelobacter sp.]|nr:hypothetical protein [Candidatus Angelobacter sp.]